MNNMNTMENVSPAYMAPVGKMNVSHSMDMMYPSNLLQTVQHCAATCDHMITHLLHHEDINCRRHQLEFLRDCADICHLNASFIARCSHLAGMMAHICEVCGNECAKFTDHHSQHCARVCLHCAQECRTFAMSA